MFAWDGVSLSISKCNRGCFLRHEVSHRSPVNRTNLSDVISYPGPGFCTDNLIHPTANDVPCRPTLTGCMAGGAQRMHIRLGTRLLEDILRNLSSHQGPGKCVKVDLLDGDHSLATPVFVNATDLSLSIVGSSVCRARSVPPTQQTYTPSISTD